MKNTKLSVEHSTDKLTNVHSRNFNLTGLEDLPRSIIPVPYYTFVQPSSNKVILPDGKRAPNGKFLMKDIRQVADELKFIILRAKRQVRQQKNDAGIVEDVVSLQILGFNLDRKRPFILGVPVTSFSALGKIFDQLEERQATAVWDYVVYVSGVEVTKPKKISGQVKEVNYWVIDAELGEALADEEKKIAEELYQDFGQKLDRDEDEDDLEEMARPFYEEPK